LDFLILDIVSFLYFKFIAEWIFGYFLLTINNDYYKFFDKNQNTYPSEINFCKVVNATAIIRGLRNPADFEFEKSVAQVNRRLSGIETLFLLTAADYSYISSSIVREIINNNGDYSSLVPDSVKNSK